MTENEISQNQNPHNPAIGRNEPCPCGSRKKYKRCCGVDAAPKVTPPNPNRAAGGGGGFDPSMLENMDPQFLTQVSQAMQKLPKGQLQRLQGIMQKAMSGKDVTAEAQDLEKNLPEDFQNLIRTWGMTMVQNMGQDQNAAGTTSSEGPTVLPAESGEDLSLQQAREIVAKAAREGKISKEEADALLNSPAPAPALEVTPTSKDEESPLSPESESKFGKFWKGFSGKKNS